MNLLEKYRAMLRPPPPPVVDNKATTGEREKVKKGFIGESPAISAQCPSVVKAEGNKGITAAPLEMKVVNSSAISAIIRWENPFPQGTPEARAESLRVIEAARKGEAIPPCDELNELSLPSVIDIDPSFGEGSTGVIPSPLEVFEARRALAVTQSQEEDQQEALTIPVGHSTPAEQPPFPEGSPEVLQQIQPPANVKSVWPPEIQLLINWFRALDPREIKPFHLEPHIHVADPVKFCAALRREIRTGPTGPRARNGVLQDDLMKLRACLK
jgi:hypothetical protein